MIGEGRALKPTEVLVPASLLLDRSLTSSAKLLWGIINLGALEVSPSYLHTQSGLARNTVRRGLAQLTATGWLPDRLTGAHSPTPQRAQTDRTVSLPSDLLLHPKIGVQAKLIYGSLQLTPGFRGNSGQFTYAQLCALVRLTDKPLHAAIRELVQHGWIQAEQQNQLAPVHFTLVNPIAELREWDAMEARCHLEHASFRGEALMREFLSLIVASDEFEDDAAPGFLVNPYTDERLQFDRYYPPAVAFEFNGAQHYRPTALYSKEAEVRRQQARDLIKIGICQRRGITLVVVHPEDLSLACLRSKLANLLPLRNLDHHGPLLAYLEAQGRAYRRKLLSARDT